MPDTVDEARARLVMDLVREGRVRSEPVYEAFTSVPRHLFLPGLEPAQAYADEAVPIKVDDGVTLSSVSQPSMVAIMLEQLAAGPGHRVLEIGAGAGWNAALVAHIVGPTGSVITLDIDDDLVRRTRSNLDAAGIPGVDAVTADGTRGHPLGAPYDRIELTVGTADVRPEWVDQLVPGGRLVLPLAVRGSQLSIAFVRAAPGLLESVSVRSCAFVRLRGAGADASGPLWLAAPGWTAQVSECGVPTADLLDDALARPDGTDLDSPEPASESDMWDGIGLWCALADPAVFRLMASGPAAESRLGTVAAGEPGRRRRPRDRGRRRRRAPARRPRGRHPRFRGRGRGGGRTTRGPRRGLGGGRPSARRRPADHCRRQRVPGGGRARGPGGVTDPVGGPGRRVAAPGCRRHHSPRPPPDPDALNPSGRRCSRSARTVTPVVAGDPGAVAAAGGAPLAARVVPDEVEDAAGCQAGPQPGCLLAGEQGDAVLGESREDDLPGCRVTVQLAARLLPVRPVQGRPGRRRGARIAEHVEREAPAGSGGRGGSGVGGRLGGQAAQGVPERPERLDVVDDVGGARIAQPVVDGGWLWCEPVADRAQPGQGVLRSVESVVDTVAVGPQRVHQLDGQQLAEQGCRGADPVVIHARHPTVSNAWCVIEPFAVQVGTVASSNAGSGIYPLALEARSTKGQPVNDSPVAALGFHDGELAVQRRAGVRAAAERLEGMLDAPDLDGGLGGFLSGRTFAGLTGRDPGGRLWISPLIGPPGFLDVADGVELRVHSLPAPGDPLHTLPVGQSVGMIAIEFARRRRVRVNGTLGSVDDGGFAVQVDQAFGNCPQYIQKRVLTPAAPAADGDAADGRRAATLAPADVAVIRRADTFLLGTSHPDRGADASHRGGPPGFVRVQDERTLWWPDYPGNNMFNSMGNLAVDPAVALLFLDFTTGETLHLSGTARLEWDTTGAGDDGGTGRRVSVTVEAVVAGPPMVLRAGDVVASPHNPRLADD